MPFQITSLSKSQLENSAGPTLRTIATHKPGFPCRVSLADAEPGEEVILTHFEHHSADTPFRASHAVYFRPNAAQAHPQPNEVPDLLRSRMLSLRAFNAAGMMIAADLTPGTDLEHRIEEMFQDPNAAYLHIHFAKPGCYAARADRANSSN
jgi:hypothetical protein